MTKKIEVFSAGCPLCEETMKTVRDLPSESCEVTVHDMNEPGSAQRAGELGVSRVPAIAVDGKLLSCCESEAPDLNKISSCCGE